jgi:hypothetical protein
VPPGRRWLVHNHFHPVSLEFTAVQGFDGSSGSLAVKLHKSKAARSTGTVAGDADGADISVGVEELAQVSVGDLRG